MIYCCSPSACYLSRGSGKDAYREAHIAALSSKHGRRQKRAALTAAALHTDPVLMRAEQIIDAAGAQEEAGAAEPQAGVELI